MERYTAYLDQEILEENVELLNKNQLIRIRSLHRSHSGAKFIVALFLSITILGNFCSNFPISTLSTLFLLSKINLKPANLKLADPTLSLLSNLILCALHIVPLQRYVIIYAVFYFLLI
jgi:hypothetical protein